MRYYIVFILFIVACNANLEQGLGESSLVVEAYIFENKPVENIKLSFVNPIASQTNPMSVSDAEVFIFSNGFYYKLVDNNNTGLFSDKNGSLKIISGNTYELLIRYNNKEYTAITTVPAPPKQLKASKDTLFINAESDMIQMTWQNPNTLWHLGIIADQNPNDTAFPFNNFFSVPTQENSLSITPNDVQSIGNKQFILYTITEDYENLYRISGSGTGSTNAGNLSNGFGIFSAFSSDTLNFVVSDK